MVLSRKTAAQTMAPAVTAVVTTCQFDRRNSLTAMLGRVRRGPITPWNALDGNPKARMVIKMAVRDVSCSLARYDETATPSNTAQKTARAVEGPRVGAAGNQARVHGERRRGAELDRDLCGTL